MTKFKRLRPQETTTKTCFWRRNLWKLWLKQSCGVNEQPSKPTQLSAIQPRIPLINKYKYPWQWGNVCKLLVLNFLIHIFKHIQLEWQKKNVTISVGYEVFLYLSLTKYLIYPNKNGPSRIGALNEDNNSAS